MPSSQNSPLFLPAGTRTLPTRIQPAFSAGRAAVSPSADTYSTRLLNRAPFFPPHSASTTNAQILVIDDNACVREVISEVLGIEGYRVQVAADGAQALDCVDRTVPALAVLDMLMPVLDGWGFARGLEARHVSLPVLVVTAGENDRDWADEIGAAGWIPKPFDVDDLIDMVKLLLRPEWPANPHVATLAAA
jgi:CheY-like chemotaxis protein